VAAVGCLPGDSQIALESVAPKLQQTLLACIAHESLEIRDILTLTLDTGTA